MWLRFRVPRLVENHSDWYPSTGREPANEAAVPLINELEK